jgi:hypothetical protein
VLFEGGEHGKLAARLTAQIIKAYVEKQRRIRNNPMLFSDKADPGSVPIAGLWNQPDLPGAHSQDPDAEHDSDQDARLQGGTLMVPIKPSLSPKRARPLTIGLAKEN